MNNNRIFRKRPVVVDAVQWTGINLHEVICFTDGPPQTRSHHAGMMWENYSDLVKRDGLKIYTLEGVMSADIGDWIIKGVKGEHYPCKPDIFAMTYESEDAPPALLPPEKPVHTDLSRTEIMKNIAYNQALNDVKALGAQPQKPAPDGWKLVPVEPTQRMIDAYNEGMVSGGATRAYRDMLAAAPAPVGDGG